MEGLGCPGFPGGRGEIVSVGDGSATMEAGSGEGGSVEMASVPGCSASTDSILLTISVEGVNLRVANQPPKKRAVRASQTKM